MFHVRNIKTGVRHNNHANILHGEWFHVQLRPLRVCVCTLGLKTHRPPKIRWKNFDPLNPFLRARENMQHRAPPVVLCVNLFAPILRSKKFQFSPPVACKALPVCLSRSLTCHIGGQLFAMRAVMTRLSCQVTSPQFMGSLEGCFYETFTHPESLYQRHGYTVRTFNWWHFCLALCILLNFPSDRALQ